MTREMKPGQKNWALVLYLGLGVRQYVVRFSWSYGRKSMICIQSFLVQNLYYLFKIKFYFIKIVQNFKLNRIGNAYKGSSIYSPSWSTAGSSFLVLSSVSCIEPVPNSQQGRRVSLALKRMLADRTVVCEAHASTSVTSRFRHSVIRTAAGSGAPPCRPGEQLHAKAQHS